MKYTAGYRLRSRGDNTFGGAHLSVCPSVHLSIVVGLPRLMKHKPINNYHYQSKVFVCVSISCFLDWLHVSGGSAFNLIGN